MNAELLLQFLRDPAWDAPFFKRLAHNDTGRAAGHQGGVVIPKALRDFFPTLDESLASATAPTVDRNLAAEMYVPGRQVATNVIRYQFQTWGGTRSAESRITSNLGPLTNLARAGDILVMQRNRERLDAFRLLLVRQSDEAFTRFDQLTRGRKCGPLFTDAPPISQSELNEARASMLAEAQQPFAAVREAAPARVETTRTAIARDAAFRAILLAQYDRRCAVSDIGLTTRLIAEGQAAHIVPLGRGGSDEPRNGFILTCTLHWAFDRGLFGIDENRTVIVPPSVRAITTNEWLVQFHGRAIREATTESLRTAQEAFAWHRQNTMWQ